MVRAIKENLHTGEILHGDWFNTTSEMVTDLFYWSIPEGWTAIVNSEEER